MKDASIKGSQFNQPLLEFHGACAGCGETAYAKLVTQLFGDRMIIANATGCSSIWGGTAPTPVYTTNEAGEGPAWANSLFEDNAEYGFGMHLGNEQLRDRLVNHAKEAIESGVSSELEDLLKEWIEVKDDGPASKEVADKIKPLLDEESDNEAVAKIAKLKKYLTKKSQWIFGGDGWAYDIGYGGLDHVVASGEDVNIMIFDTEVYSNTGGQSSKATPVSAVAKFAASGKRTAKKDLAQMLMTYGNVYVAQVAIGADMNQTVKAINEAEAYDGPSVVIAYTPCIAHGLKAGMNHSVNQEGKAVETGYWHLFRFNPELEEEGKNPFSVDSKEPTGTMKEYMESEVRFASLQQTFPEVAEKLFEFAQKQADKKYKAYKRLEKAYEPEDDEE